ncbi:MAG TPA: MFS transporter [Solirubrobacteraceae bacterium]
MTTRTLARRFAMLRALRWLPLGITLPFLVLLPQDRGLSLAEVGVIFAMHSIVAILLEVPSGGLADAIGRRITLVIGGVLTAAGLAVFAVATGVPAFMLALGVIAAGRALISGSLEAWFVDEARAIDPELALHRPLATAATVEGVTMAAAATAGGLLPALLGGGLDESGGATLVKFSVPSLAGVAGALVFVAAVLRYVEEPTHVRTGGWRAAGATTIAGLKAARASRTVRLLLLSALAVGTIMSTTELLWQPRLADLLGGGSAGNAPLFGALAAASMLAAALGSALSPRLSRAAGRARAFPGAYVALGLSLALLAVVDTVALFCVVYLAYFWAVGVVDPIHYETLHDAIEGRNRATIASAEGLAMQTGGIGGNLVLTPLAGAAGLALAWGVCAGLALCAAALAAGTRASAPARPRPRPAAPSGAA